jgi:hypothetical protein
MCYIDLTRHTMDADILTDVCNVYSTRLILTFCSSELTILN